MVDPLIEKLRLPENICVVDMTIGRWSRDSRKRLGLELFFSYNALVAFTSLLLLSFAIPWMVKAVLTE